MNGGGPQRRKPVLAVPACEPGRGGGHLTRCMAMVRGLRALGREAWLLLPEHAGDYNALFASAAFDREWRIGGEDAPDGTDWECIVLDRFQTPAAEFSRWAALAPVIGIDEGGPCRDRFDFLVDLLPGFHGASPPNITDPSLLLTNTGNKRASTPVIDSSFKTLISFGQEDAAGLGLAAAAALAARGGGLLDITLLAGGLNHAAVGGMAPQGVRLLETIPRLGEHLAGYDLLITHYGITAFEALYAGTPVLLVSPTAYHEKLAAAAGFCSAGRGKRGAAAAASLLIRRGTLNTDFITALRAARAALAVRHSVDRDPKQSLAALINGFTPNVSRHCPVCGAPLPAAENRRGKPSAARRYADRTYRRCPSCGVIGMSRVNPPPIEYEREYFFEFYQQQYGKTYIEDFPHLIAMGKRRLAVIKALLAANAGRRGEDGAASDGPHILDIGCAYGPFLAAARDGGCSPVGVDPAEDAVRYVTQTLALPAVRGFFPDVELPPGGPPFDAVTLWFVIEHFQDCVPVFAAIRRLLKSGGVLAFATPSFSGVSGRASLERFLRRSPADHWTVWSPAVCKKALARAGFTVKKIVVSGCHPERFPLLGQFAKNKKSPLYGLLLCVSKMFRLGDTFEVYAARC